MWPCMGLACPHELCHMASLTWAYMGRLTRALLFRPLRSKTDDDDGSNPYHDAEDKAFL